MSDLPVREMVLYKHGVGFFVREGNLSGDSVTLAFKADEINDVLKSLAAFDRAGGQILGIHYQTPMDKDARLATTSIRLDHQTVIRDLLRDLGGREVELTIELAPGTLETISGRVIGLDERGTKASSEAPEAASMVAILVAGGTVNLYPLKTIRAVTIKDAQSAHDLNYFLDTVVGDDERRTVTVRLSDGDHQLVVYYVAPSPTWRVSYRLVAETDEDGTTGKALLQGWGLFDNRLEEDLERVRVTLVAGQPISFIYDLYASRIPDRPVIEDEARVAPGPVEYAQAKQAPSPRARAAARLARHMEADAMFESAASEPVGMLAGPAMQMAAAAAQPQAEGKATGETFQYIVTAPVSVKRGESALVPIIGSEIGYERELLYNRDKLPNHPTAALRFKNTTNLTLERGPVTLVEDGDYKGEAIIPFTGEDNEVYVPYAVELGIKVTERESHDTITHGLHIQGEFVVYEQYAVLTTRYTIDNSTSQERTLTIEAPIIADYTPFDMPVPDAETATTRRWKIAVAASDSVEFVRRERQKLLHRQAFKGLSYRNLQDFLKNRWLGDVLHNQLKEIVDKYQLIHELQKKSNELEEEHLLLNGKQEKTRANMVALQPSGREANLRNRLLDQMEANQDRLEAIDKELASIEQGIETTQAEIEALIQALNQPTQASDL